MLLTHCCTPVKTLSLLDSSARIRSLSIAYRRYWAGKTVLKIIAIIRCVGREALLVMITPAKEWWHTHQQGLDYSSTGSFAR
jgi:hypothetical protein